MAVAAAFRLARRVADARTADGLLHGQPRRRLPVRLRLTGGPEHDAFAHLSVHDRLPALGGAALHLHGGDPREGGDHRGAIRRHLQVARLAQGRPRLGNDHCLHRARGDGGRGRRDRDHDGHDRLAGDAQARLRPEDRLRLASRWRHARHPDPALGDGDRLCGRCAAIARRVADRLCLSGVPAGRHVRGLRDDPLHHQPEAGGRRCRWKSASTSARSFGC